MIKIFIKKLLTVSLSLAIILTFLPTNTVEVHAEAQYISFQMSSLRQSGSWWLTQDIRQPYYEGVGVDETLRINFEIDDYSSKCKVEDGIFKPKDTSFRLSLFTPTDHRKFYQMCKMVLVGDDGATITVYRNQFSIGYSQVNYVNLRGNSQGKVYVENIGQSSIYLKEIRIYYHDLEAKSSAATCTTAGYKTYYKCKDSGCNRICTENNVFKPYIVTQDTYGITGFGTEAQWLSANSTAALGHSYSTTWSNNSTQHWQACTRCGKTINTAYHSGGTATCTTQAVCSTCKKAYGSALGHTVTKHNAVQANCTHGGNSDYWECTRCHKFFGVSNPTSSNAGLDTANSFKTPLSGHTWTYSGSTSDNVVNTITATCLNDANHTATLTVSAQDKVYTGSPYTGTTVSNWSVTTYNLGVPTVTYVGRGQTSYTESTTAPKYVGTYTVKITYQGATASANFEITPKVVELNWHKPEFTYNMQNQAPTATVLNNAEGDVVNVDIAVTSDTINNISDIEDATKLTVYKDAGDYTAIASLSGADAKNYVLPSTLSEITHAYTIDPKPLGSADVSITALCDVEGQDPTNHPNWKAGGYTPVIAVKDGTTNLVLNTDYTQPSNTDLHKVDPGLYEVTITGSGNYTGHKTIGWAIVGQTFSDGVITVNPTYERYNGQSHEIKIDIDRTQHPNATVVYSSTGVDGSYSNVHPSCVGVGTYTIYYRVNDDQYYHYDQSTVTVMPRIVNLEWSTTPLTYNGELQSPTPTITNVVEGEKVSVDVVLGKEKNAGTGYIAVADTLKGTNKDNYIITSQTENRTKEFTIAKVLVNVPEKDTTKFTYNREPHTYALATNTAYTISSDPEHNTTQTNAGTYDIFVAINDKDNYEWNISSTDEDERVEDLTYEFTIDPRNISKTAKISINHTTYFEYNNEQKEMSLTVCDDLSTTPLVVGDVVNGEDYTLTNYRATDIGKYLLTINFHNNYTGSIVIPWEIVEEVNNPKGVEIGTEEEPYNGDNEFVVTNVGDEDVPEIDIENPKDLLNEDDLDILENGNPEYKNDDQTLKKVVMEIVLSINMNEDKIHEDSKTAIDELAKNPKESYYYDISLNKVIKYLNADNTVYHIDVVPINETAKDVELTIHLPEEILPVKGGYSRKFTVIRSHNIGTIDDPVFEAKVLDTQYQKSSDVYLNGAVTFGSNRFSDFALTYKDTLIPRHDNGFDGNSTYIAPNTSVR